ncbi:ABC transporter permease subunit [Embleya sp. NBC_00896]|uniref:ABC transporter permease subunit n=1 Tax=Embleya sp. NBC_00896 TaxID=2975961 RepID=UPI003867ECDF|nr:ABC transporter permease subunit [Embleya sp. NBC_00896]
MIWLTWRQFRTQALVTLGALVVLAIYLVFLGMTIRDGYDSRIADCVPGKTCAAAENRFESDYKAQLALIGGLLLIVPAIIGTFWGAPLITRELETGTHRLVWNQSITRVRWLAIKVAIIALATVIVAGLFSALLTWAARPYDQVVGNRFDALVFGSRNLAPLGYAVFAFALGTTVGLLIRRTVPAMAVTLVVFAVVQVVMPYVRPYLLPPKETSIAVDATSLPRVSSFILEGGGDESGDAIPTSSTIRVESYGMPGALVLTSSSRILTAEGKPVRTDAAVQSCLEPAQPDLASSGACLAKQNLHFDVTYQPANRYWTFQSTETGLFLGLALLLTGFSLWRIPRGLA